MSQPLMPMVVDALVPRSALDDGMRSRARILVGARDARKAKRDQRQLDEARNANSGVSSLAIVPVGAARATFGALPSLGREYIVGVGDPVLGQQSAFAHGPLLPFVKRARIISATLPDDKSNHNDVHKFLIHVLGGTHSMSLSKTTATEQFNKSRRRIGPQVIRVGALFVLRDREVRSELETGIVSRTENRGFS